MKNRLLGRMLAMVLSAALVIGMCGCGEQVPAESTTEVAESVTVEKNDATDKTEAVEETQETEEQTTAEEVVASNIYEAGPIADNAVDFAANMKMGWNLGNTLDATDGSGLGSETSWGQPEATQELIRYIKEAGFTTIRIPTSWHNHMVNGVIDSAWMDRVQQVVDWSMDAGLYVILNSHHDNVKNKGYYPAAEYEENSITFLTNVWTQVAERFKDYDEHLVFESMNEPRLRDTAKEWYFAADDAEGIACIKLIVEYNQLFVDTVRKSGGYNETRFLMVPSAIASPDNAMNSAFEMPKDTIENHLILSVHAYTPYNFAMNADGYKSWSSDKAGELNFITKLRDQFCKAGYGVCIGEFGATNKDNLKARCSWAKAYTGRCEQYGLSCILWDNGSTGIGEENFGMIDRKNLSVYFPELLEAYLEAFH